MHGLIVLFLVFSHVYLLCARGGRVRGQFDVTLRLVWYLLATFEFCTFLDISVLIICKLRFMIRYSTDVTTRCPRWYDKTKQKRYQTISYYLMRSELVRYVSTRLRYLGRTQHIYIDFTPTLPKVSGTLQKDRKTIKSGII